jgi:uncharacterized Zn finger protein
MVSADGITPGEHRTSRSLQRTYRRDFQDLHRRAREYARRAPMHPLANILHRKVLLRLTDTGTYTRGLAYYRDNRVAALTRSESMLKGTVRGSTDYEVKIWVSGDGLAYACTCPIGLDGLFCKHAVALAMAWLGAHEKPRSPARGAAADVDLRARLERADKPRLVAFLLREVEADAELHERVLRAFPSLD